MDVLVEGIEEDGQLFGRAMCQAPDVDGETYLTEGNVGDIVRVRIAESNVDRVETGGDRQALDDFQHHHARAHLPRPGVRRGAYHSLADLVQYCRRFIDHKKPDCGPYLHLDIMHGLA